MEIIKSLRRVEQMSSFESLPMKEKPAGKASKEGELYSATTVKIYQTALNKMAKATGVETVAELKKKKNHKKIVQYIDESEGDYHKKRVIYSGIFYALGYLPQAKIATLFDGFKKYKVPDPSEKKEEK